jgi:hypothetical protein
MGITTAGTAREPWNKGKLCQLWHAYTPPNQSDVDLPADKESACSSVAAGSYQTGEHIAVSRH